MDGRDSQSLLALRKLTRAITEAVRGEMSDRLATLTPLLRPSAVLGDYVLGGQKETTRKAERAFKQLQGLYETVATAKPFNLPRELSPPLNIAGDGLEITPLDSPHVTGAGGNARTIQVRSPLTWTLTYSGYGPGRLQELLNTKMRSIDDVLKFVLSYLVLHVVINNQTGILPLMESLRFPITTVKMEEFGGLPITRVGPPISTTRPSDAVIIESADITGVDAFEELVKTDDVSRLKDPLRERLIEIANQHLPESIAR